MHTVIAFDVVDDRQRTKLARELLGFGVRVQKSVFEARELAEAAYLRMRSLCERHIDPDVDRIRYYRMCAACARRIEHFGAGPLPVIEVSEVEWIGRNAVAPSPLPRPSNLHMAEPWLFLIPR